MEFGYAISSAKLLSSLSPKEKVVSPSRYWHIPGFVPAMPVTMF